MNQPTQQTPTQPLRFAPLIRVSTEGQGKRGESLRTQKTQITQYVRALHGVIPEGCWQYSGQEHGTPDYERKKLAQLLHDAGKGVFDAVIVCDASRWSRDNRKSKEGLEVLRQHGIRFFVAATEYDLYSPEQTFFLGMSAEIGEFQARTQKQKSIVNRIERVKRGVPASGKPPFGRIFDKKTETWGLDQSKASMIQQAASRYLAGESMLKIAPTIGLSSQQLWKVLTRRCGDTWEVHFKDIPSKIDETITMTIPRLLDEETIAAIQARGEANKTFSHGAIKNHYILSRMIFCECCGSALLPQTNKSGNQYYRHQRHREENCPMRKCLPAALVESTVLANLVSTFGDIDRIEKAIQRAIPDHGKLEALRQEHDDHKQRLSNAKKQRDNLVRLASKGLLSDEEIEKQMGEVRIKIAAIEERMAAIDSQTTDQPTAQQVRKRASSAIRVLRHVTSSPDALENMSNVQRRKLAETIFGGKDAEGRRLGVYVRFNPDDKLKRWSFEIRGILDHIVKDLLCQSIEEGFYEDEEKYGTISSYP